MKKIDTNFAQLGKLGLSLCNISKYWSIFDWKLPRFTKSLQTPTSPSYRTNMSFARVCSPTGCSRVQLVLPKIEYRVNTHIHLFSTCTLAKYKFVATLGFVVSSRQQRNVQFLSIPIKWTYPGEDGSLLCLLKFQNQCPNKKNSLRFMAYKCLSSDHNSEYNLRSPLHQCQEQLLNNCE